MHEAACRSQLSAFSRYCPARDCIETSPYPPNDWGARLFRASEQQCPLWVKSRHMQCTTAWLRAVAKDRPVGMIHFADFHCTFPRRGFLCQTGQGFLRHATGMIAPNASYRTGGVPTGRERRLTVIAALQNIVAHAWRRSNPCFLAQVLHNPCSC